MEIKLRALAEIVHVQRRYSGCIGQRMMDLELTGRRKRGTFWMTLLNVVKKDMQ